MAHLNNQPKTGDCECCNNTAVALAFRHGNTWQCGECDAKEATVLTMAVDANKMIQEVRAVDEKIVLKTDIYNAQTPAVVKLIESVMTDTSIPADKKDYVIAQQSLEHFKHLQQVIFEERQAFVEMMRLKENEMRMWQTQVQTSASKLQAELREKFKGFDNNYVPTPVKSVKTARTQKDKTPAEFKKQELLDACKKYAVPMAQARAIMIQKNITAEAAAKLLHSALNG